MLYETNNKDIEDILKCMLCDIDKNQYEEGIFRDSKQRLKMSDKVSFDDYIHTPRIVVDGIFKKMVIDLDTNTTTRYDNRDWKPFDESPYIITKRNPITGNGDLLLFEGGCPLCFHRYIIEVVGGMVRLLFKRNRILPLNHILTRTHRYISTDTFLGLKLQKIKYTKIRKNGSMRIGKHIDYSPPMPVSTTIYNMLIDNVMKFEKKQNAVSFSGKKDPKEEHEREKFTCSGKQKKRNKIFY